MTAAASELRLAAVQVCGYRAFPVPIAFQLARHDGAGKPLGKGRNLLLFGENGSGKSSFGKAVRDLLDYKSTATAFDEYKYRFTDPPRTDRGVTLIFDDPAIDALIWNPTARDVAHRDFADMARSCGWLDYRVIWRASEVRWGDSVEIFKPLVEEILPGCLRGTSNETFGDAWERITSAAGKKPIKGRASGAVAKLEGDIKLFNDSLEAFLPDLEKQVNGLITRFVPWTSIEMKWMRGARYDSSSHRNKFSHGSIQVKMVDRGGPPLKKPAEFLNEARLTAIGLCLYLAGMSQSIPPKRPDGSTYPRLLILDDVLLSLDMAHRLPLVRLIQDRKFTGWQILLLTHDRAWYEIAKQQLEGWHHCELFAQRVGDHDQPMLRQDQDYLSTAIDHLTRGDVKAAAVYVRTKFELVLKSACHELGVAVKYNPDPRKITVADFWAALKGATFESIPPVAHSIDGKGQLHWWQPSSVKTRVVSVGTQKNIEHAVKWVLNPLSHSETVAYYQAEIEEAIFVVNDLEREVRKAIAMRQAGPTLLREMLLSLLKTRASKAP